MWDLNLPSHNHCKSNQASSVLLWCRELHPTFRFLHCLDGCQLPCQSSTTSLPGEYSGVSPTSVSHGKPGTFIPLWWGQAPPLSQVYMLLEFMIQDFLRLCNQKKIIWIGLLLYMGSHWLQWNTEHFLRLENFPLSVTKFPFLREEKGYISDSAIYTCRTIALNQKLSIFRIHKIQMGKMFGYFSISSPTKLTLHLCCRDLPRQVQSNKLMNHRNTIKNRRHSQYRDFMWFGEDYLHPGEKNSQMLQPSLVIYETLVPLFYRRNKSFSPIPNSLTQEYFSIIFTQEFPLVLILSYNHPFTKIISSVNL